MTKNINALRNCSIKFNFLLPKKKANYYRKWRRFGNKKRMA